MKNRLELGFFVLGLVAIITGLALVYIPAAFIGAGILMIATALASRKGGSVISLLLPTRMRPEKFAKTCASVELTVENSRDVEIIAYLQDDDPRLNDYKNRFNNSAEYPFARYVVGPRITMSDMWNVLLPHAAGDIFMLCADDVLFRTKGWNVEIEKTFALRDDRIMLAFANDGGPNGRTFASLPFVSREWVNAVGYFTGPGFSCDYSDTWPNDVADMIGRKVFVPVLIEHMHWIWNKAEYDQVYEENQHRLYRDDCRGRYEATLTERMRDADKLRKAIEAYHGKAMGAR